jgi:hypothetical protein
VVAQPLLQLAGLTDVDGVVELGEEVDPGGVGDPGVLGDRCGGRGQQSLEQLREIGGEAIEDVDPRLMDLDGHA